MSKLEAAPVDFENLADLENLGPARSKTPNACRGLANDGHGGSANEQLENEVPPRPPLDHLERIRAGGCRNPSRYRTAKHHDWELSPWHESHVRGND